MTAFLTGYFADRVEFVVVGIDGVQRSATVLRHPGSFASMWLSLEFPHSLNDCGASLGNADLDNRLKLQAHAEIVRHRALLEAVAA